MSWFWTKASSGSKARDSLGFLQPQTVRAIQAHIRKFLFQFPLAIAGKEIYVTEFWLLWDAEPTLSQQQSSWHQCFSLWCLRTLIPEDTKRVENQPQNGEMLRVIFSSWRFTMHINVLMFWEGSQKRNLLTSIKFKLGGLWTFLPQVIPSQNNNSIKSTLHILLCTKSL